MNKNIADAKGAGRRALLPLLLGCCVCSPAAMAGGISSTLPIPVEQSKGNKISGRVIDSNGEPVIGASILVKGTRTGTSTNTDGQFSINAKPGDVLVISYVGMKTVEVAANNNGVVTLEPKADMLDEVLVTGYQTISKERSTGAFSKVNSDKLELKRMDNLSSMLEGQIAGYVDGKVRGISTMKAISNPLIVIDGFPVESTTMDKIGRTTEGMPDINPEDVESITVLKDAAAASIYGARAANGVIVITTKKARKGDAEVSFSTTLTTHPYSYYSERRTNAADVVAMECAWAASELTSAETAAALAGDIRDGAAPSLGVSTLLDMYSGKISKTDGQRILDNLAKKGYQYTDQAQQYGKRNPFYQQYNLRVGKTTDNNTFNFSTTFWNNEYEDVNHDDWKVGINLNNTLKLTNWLQFNAGVYLKYGKENNQSYSLFNPGYSAMPYDALVNEDGSYAVAPIQNDKTRREVLEQYGLLSEHLTPMEEFGYNRNTTNSVESRVFGQLKLDFTSWLNYNVMFQYETNNSNLEALTEKETNFMRTRINSYTGEPTYYGPTYNLPYGDSFYTLANSKTAYDFRQQLNLDKHFDENNNLIWILGQEVRHSRINFNDNTLFGYDPDLLSWQVFDAESLKNYQGLFGYTPFDTNSLASSRELVNRFVSFYSNASYTMDNRYTLSGSIRWDRSNIWGTNSKYQNRPLWSVGAAWNISEEPFFSTDFVNMLKLRSSYGVGGNIGRNTAPYLVASYVDSGLANGLAGMVSTPPNRDIRWEKTETINCGVDFSMFQNRLNGSVEFYNKNSYDLLASINGSPVQGFGYSVITTNNAGMRNRGVEVSLNGEVFRNQNVVWNSTILYSYNRNEVTSISVKPSPWDARISMPTSYPSLGNPYFGLYAYKWAGLNEKGDPQVYDAEGNVTDGPVRDADALVFAGTTVPVHNVSWTNVVRYRDLEFSAFLTLNAGHKLRSSSIPSINMTSGRITSTAKDIVNRWTKPGDVTDIPRLLFSNDTENFNSHRTELFSYSDLFVYDASNVRINNLSVAYRLPSKLCKKVWLKNAKLQFNVENVATFAFDSRAHYDLGGKIKPNYVMGLNLNF